MKEKFNLIIEFIKKYKIEIFLGIFLIGIISYTTFSYSIPFKSYGDIWSHIADVNQLKKPFNDIGDPFFYTGSKDPHYSPYFVVIALLSNITSINLIILMEIFGILSIVLLYYAFIEAYYSFLPDRKMFLVDKVVLFLAVFFMWESSNVSYAGYYSLADLSITALFPHIFATACFLFGISFTLKLLNLLSSRKIIDKKIILKAFTLSLIIAFIFLTHVITGVIFIYSLIIIYIYYYLTNFKKKLNQSTVILLFIIIIGISVTFLWPYYSIIETFSSQTIHTDTSLTSIFEFKDWITVGGIAFIGIIASFKTKNKLLIFWFISLMLILLSYLYPIRISSYWRFFPIFLIPLYFLITEWISKLSNVIRTFLIFLILIFGINSFINKIDTIGLRQPVTLESFVFLKNIPNEKLILSDPETSYLFSGLTNHPVLVISKTHWNPDNTKASQERYDDNIAFWTNHNYISQKQIIEKYNIEYILFNKKIYPNFIDYIITISINYNITQLYNDNSYLLIKVNL